jgi:hypothetical protein
VLRSEVAIVKVQKGAAEKELKAVLLELEEMTCARDEADAYLGDQLAITLQLETSLKHQLAEATRLQDECTKLLAANEQRPADSRPCTACDDAKDAKSKDTCPAELAASSSTATTRRQ